MPIVILVLRFRQCIVNVFFLHVWQADCRATVACSHACRTSIGTCTDVVVSALLNGLLLIESVEIDSTRASDLPIRIWVLALVGVDSVTSLGSLAIVTVDHQIFIWLQLQFCVRLRRM